MKLNKLIEKLKEIQKKYANRKIDIMIVNNYLVIREITEDSEHCHSAVLIDTIEFE